MKGLETVIGSITCLGEHVRDRHTHYELHGHVGPFPATIEIPGYVADAFREKYGKPIEQSGRITVTADFLRNDQLIAECQNPYRSASHLTGSIRSDSDISIN